MAERPLCVPSPEDIFDNRSAVKFRAVETDEEPTRKKSSRIKGSAKKTQKCGAPRKKPRIKGPKKTFIFAEPSFYEKSTWFFFLRKANLVFFAERPRGVFYFALQVSPVCVEMTQISGFKNSTHQRRHACGMSRAASKIKVDAK